MPKWIEKWNPEDKVFWENEGKHVARRNLIFSIFAEFLGFSVWQLFSVVSALLVSVGFGFSVNQLFWLVAIPGLIGATMRFVYTPMVAIFGGANWTVISALLLLIPTISLGVVVQNPDTPYWVFLLVAAAAGFGGGNFASSMANISYFYPSNRKGFALGINAAGGNVGFSLVQFIVPMVITFSIFGMLAGAPQIFTPKNGPPKEIWLQNAGFFWVPLIVLAALGAYFFMNNLHVARASLREQSVILRRKHTWLMSWLYIGTFGSFSGYSAAFPLLLTTQFPEVSALKYAFIGPLLGSIVRPLGGWLSDRIGGARVTLVTFFVMIAGVAGVLFFLNTGSFLGFFITFMTLFTAAGVGNGSTYRMIPVIFHTEREREHGMEDEEARDRAMREGLRETAAVLGFAGAIAAYGSFLIPRAYGVSINATGGISAALYVFIAFYVTCIAVTWYYYHRKDCEIPC